MPTSARDSGGDMQVPSSSTCSHLVGDTCRGGVGRKQVLDGETCALLLLFPAWHSTQLQSAPESGQKRLWDFCTQISGDSGSSGGRDM